MTSQELTGTAALVVEADMRAAARSVSRSIVRCLARIKRVWPRGSGKRDQPEEEE